MRCAIYPGSFDPITNGHINLIKRAVLLFDKVVVAVAHNIKKTYLFNQEERVALIKQVVGNIKGVDVDSFEGLLVDYAEKIGASVIIRGLRAVSDFEYEFQMAHMNHKLCPNIETIFMVTGPEEFFISSHMVKEVAGLGGSVEGLVPKIVAEALKKKLSG